MIHAQKIKEPFVPSSAVSKPKVGNKVIKKTSMIDKGISSDSGGDRAESEEEESVSNDDDVRMGEANLPSLMTSGEGNFSPLAASDHSIEHFCDSLNPNGLYGDREKQVGVNGTFYAHARKVFNGLPHPCSEVKGFTTEESSKK
ncbi:hypothetical protein U1Q18_022600, partial [Sarracenia purpurea var. burkii]